MRERTRDADTQIGAGRWAIAVITALYAVVRLACAAHGLAALSGAADGMRDALLMQGGGPALAARYDAARPIVVGLFLALGCAQLATAWFLSRGQIRRFLAAWSIALLAAGSAVAIQLSILRQIEGIPSEFHALLVQAVAVPALLAWSHTRRRRRPRR